jgi:ABC-type sugar transport system ATPase subunit
MDEPISNLDAKLREQTRIEIRKLLRKFGISTLYVTHDQQEAIFLGDRIAVMRDGRIEQVGTFDDLYYSPANLYVATFIGSPPLTVLPATVADGRISVGPNQWPLGPELASVLPQGPVRIGVRPENWHIDTDDGLALRIRHAERIPTERASFLYASLHNVSADGGPGRDGAQAAIAVPLDYPCPAEARATPDWDRAYFFAADSEAPLHLPGVLDLF